MNSNDILASIVFGGDGGGGNQITKVEELSTDGGSTDAGKVLVVGDNGKIAASDLTVGEGEVAIDKGLVVNGAAADAKVVGDAITSLNGSLENIDIRSNVKNALAKCFRKVAYIDDDGAELYAELVNALDNNNSAYTYYTVIQTLDTGINSTYTKLSVEKNASLSITLSAGNGYAIDNVIVTMNGVDYTATAYNANTGVISIASVTGDVMIEATSVASIISDGLVRRWVASDSDGSTWTDRVSSAVATLSGVTKDSNALVFNGSAFGYADMPSDLNAQTLEVIYESSVRDKYMVVKTNKVMCALPTTARRVVVSSAQIAGTTKQFRAQTAGSNVNKPLSDISTFNGVVNGSNYYVYYRGSVIDQGNNNNSAYLANNSGKIEIGAHLSSELAPSGGIGLKGKIYEIRLYNRVLSEEERLHNYAIDKLVYNIS